TLAIQKRSGEVWKVLGEVKTEFGKFNEVLLKAQERIKLADMELEKLITTRSNVMERKLRNVEALPISEADKPQIAEEITLEVE
ncbi:MAG: DNA recombination protein RmuC, partial [Oscillospiraceae bacterium]|nr:DNA recombination protein RmuC [Oscillospiraceae bacterium]